MKINYSITLEELRYELENRIDALEDGGLDEFANGLICENKAASKDANTKALAVEMFKNGYYAALNMLLAEVESYDDDPCANCSWVGDDDEY